MVAPSASTLRLAAATLVLAATSPLACSRGASEAIDAAERSDATATPSSVDGGDAAGESSDAAYDGEADAQTDGSVTAPDAEADAAPHVEHRYRAVLHLGDSEVGLGGGLTWALRRRFLAHHARFVSNSLASASIESYDAEPRVTHLVKAVNPDLVILNLGTNDLLAPSPKYLVGHIRSLVKKISAGGRDCVWVGPPHLPAAAKHEAAVDDVIREHVAPCRYFESRRLALALRHDHIHPNDKGGEAWGAQLYRFIVADEPPSGPFLEE